MTENTKDSETPKRVEECKQQIEQVLLNRIKLIGVEDQLYTGYPEQLIGELTHVFTNLLQQQIQQDIERMEKIKETPAYVNLSREWGQLDEDGICIAVSRQALEETISAWDDLINYKKDQLTKNV